ncbi:type II toxin-antitoxin system PemK/MazF family toxin [Trinickia sp.]|uniref:type II toxin-antitoxin system PemK/MazF family toxin n=1 Tax=Trinickia sp. TaxID=2571163 RepID=UPI003F7FF625
MKVGQIVECNFGLYRPGPNGKHHVDGHMPPEMIKNRLAVVINTRLRSAYVVIPLSSTRDRQKESRGFHIKIPPAHLPETTYWTPCDRWAKAELMQHVSAARVRTLRADNGRYITQVLPRDTVAEIQRAVVQVIGGSRLMIPVEPPAVLHALGLPRPLPEASTAEPALRPSGLPTTFESDGI